MPMVIDTSVTMAWCFEDEATVGSDAVLDRLRDDVAVVPALWNVEVANVLLVAERRRQITEAHATRFLELLAALPIEVDLDAPDVDTVIATGRRHRLSAYDATYLVLAERHAMPLATLDTGLGDAARSAGVAVLGGEG